MSQLSLFLLGMPRLTQDGQPIEINRRKVMALLIYLALTDAPHSRDTLATLLWPEFDQSRARGALRRTLSVLNTTLGEGWLETTRESVGLNKSEQFWIDVTQFCRQAVRATESKSLTLEQLNQFQQTVDLYQDDFLAGFSLRDSPDFDEWQFFQADELRSHFIKLVQQLAEGYKAVGEDKLALDNARRWLERDSLNEAAHREVMLLYAKTQQHTAAIRQYRECVRLLQSELGLDPSPETEQLYQQIRTRSLRDNHQSDHIDEPRHTNGSSNKNGVHKKNGNGLNQPAFLTQTPRHPTPPTPFVAREAELARLNDFLSTTINGQGQIVFITGEAGSGKTALIQAFAQQAQQRYDNLVVGIGNCNAHTGPGDPYLPFRDILGLLTGDVETKWAEGLITQENARRLWLARQDVLKTITELGPDLVSRFLPHTASVAIAGRKPASYLTVAYQQQALYPAQNDLFEQYTLVLQALARKTPLLLLIDDAQWLDTASINLLFHLSRHLTGCPLLLIVTYRPDEFALRRPMIGGSTTGSIERHPLEAVVNEVRRVHGDIHIDLKQSQSQAFVEALLNSNPNQLDAKFRNALYQQTQGHPLFTVELLRDMQERGDIVRNPQGQWVSGTTLDWHTLPARVEAVIAERFGRLDPELRDLLTVASVEGEQFTAQVLAKVQGRDERDVLRTLSQILDRQHHLIQDQGEIEIDEHFLSRYRFSHTLFQHYLYQTLSPGEQRLLHGDIAYQLEQIYQADLETILVQLAHHYLKAGQTDKAVPYLLQAGDKARYLHAHRQAIDFYSQALSYLKAEQAFKPAAHTLMKLGLTHHLAFDFPAAYQAYDEGFLFWQQAEASHTTSPPPAPHPLRLSEWNPITLDSAYTDDDTSVRFISQLFVGLVALTVDLDIVPEIASSWEVLDDGHKYVFRLREDIYWSDGTQLTAHDFIYAWKRILQPDRDLNKARYLFDIKGARAYCNGEVDELGIDASDPFTVMIELEGPTSYFPQLLSQWPYLPAPRHVVEQHGDDWATLEHIVSYGPFLLTEWVPNHHIQLDRNPDYRGQFSGNVQTIDLKLNIDEEITDKMYEADELDLLYLGNYLERGDYLRQRYAPEYFMRPQLMTRYIAFNTNVPPFDDIRVRQALALSINKEAMAGVTLRGYCFPADGGFTPPGMPGHVPSIGLPYDPDHAQRLLAEAGYPNGQGFPTLSSIVKPGKRPECDYISESWARHLGISVDWEVLPWKDLLERVNDNPPLLYMMGWTPDYPDPDNMLRVATPLSDRIDWYNEHFIELVEQARHKTSQAERMQLYYEAEKILIKEVAVIPLYYGRGHCLIKPWVTKFPTSPFSWHYWKDVVIEPH